ncbi:MAG: ATP-binding protein [Cyclobacteriaceae bacterium]|nr:ATP-binding protein [Cyclobacteriaceae bacterium]
MEQILLKSSRLVQNQALDFERSLAKKVDWSDRLIGIVGARGTGKTTLLIQQLKRKELPPQQAAYLSLDDIYFTDNRLVAFAESFIQLGGQFLFIDEVHKYPDWAREVKNLYDTYPELRIVFSGSSIIDILQQNADLSRRAVQYELSGLSYREYLEFNDLLKTQPISLPDLVSNHTMLAAELTQHFKPLQHLSEYLNVGYYPFFAENKNTYTIRVEQLIKMITETDLRFIEGFDPANTRKIYQLLYILAVNVPFKPNVSKLSEKIGLHRNTLVQYLHYLDRARLVNSLTAAGRSISTLQKPDKIYLENTNLQYALAPQTANRGTLRETFIMNQLVNAHHTVTLPRTADFLVNDTYTLEVGGRYKTATQLRNTSNSLVIADDIETGLLNKVPLWLFGFLY